MPLKLAPSIRVFNRETGAYEVETVMGARALRWAYASRLGSAIRRLVLRRRWVSALYGRYIHSRLSRRLIQPFIDRFSIDLSEIETPPGGFRSFNEFFYRRFKPGARPFEKTPEALGSPAEGRVKVWPRVDSDTAFSLKGERFSISKLIGDPTIAAPFVGGSALVVRLCPTDYHRFHFFDSGTCEPARRIKGPLESVNPLSLRLVGGVFETNERQVARFKSDHFGSTVIVEIGALLVGSVVQTYTPNTPVVRGSEKGYFAFGGSTVIVLFEPGRVTFCDDLIEMSSAGIETLIRCGARIGRGSRVTLESHAP